MPLFSVTCQHVNRDFQVYIVVGIPADFPRNIMIMLLRVVLANQE